MTEGLLWFNRDPKKDLTKKVEEAASRYHHKFGQRPNLCYVHSSMVDTSVQVDGVRVVPAKNRNPGEFWIGVEDELREAA